ncbi:MAG: TIGR04255 family protein, partial [Spirulinaceae cyanobacterium]
MTSTQYSKVPITEALIDFRVRPVCVENLTKFQSVLSTDYPLHKEIVEFETQVELHGDEQRSSFNQTLAGYQIADQKRTSVLKVEVNGFTFSQLGSYRGWASLRDEARSLWKIYCTVVEPKTVLRTSIRYINKIDLPLNDSENFTFQDYLRVLPEVPKELGPG